MRSFVLCLALLGVNGSSVAQFVLKGEWLSSPPDARLVVNVPYDCWYESGASREVHPGQNGRFSVRLPVRKPQVVFLDVGGKRLRIYAEPGKSLTVRMDARNFPEKTTFSGDLERENRFRCRFGLASSGADTLRHPDSLLAHSRKRLADARAVLRKGPFSRAFDRMASADLTWQPFSLLWEKSWEANVWTTGQRPEADRNLWRKALAGAYESVNLSDSSALSSYPYQLAVTYYPRFVQYRAANRGEFATWAEQRFGKPFRELQLEMREKGETYWEYLVLEDALTGVARERALSSLLIHQVTSGELGYLRELADRFRRQFPESVFLPDLDAAMQPYLRRTGEKDIRWLKPANSLDSLLAPYRGQVVLVDLWGSWCGPCREEFAHLPALKKALKEKPVVFLYIASEHTPNPDRRWRETVRFYELTGDHVLAGKKLEEEIRQLYMGHLVFPSYLLVDKNGRIVHLRAARPSEKSTLLSQIEKEL